MSKFWIVCAFIETIVWTALVPYLIWQQWGWIPAVILLAWWLLGYWRAWLTAVIKYHLVVRRQFQARMDEITDPAYYEEDPLLQYGTVEPLGGVAEDEDTEVLPNLDDFDDQCHKWIDEGGQ
jgi:hypothetical protein